MSAFTPMARQHLLRNHMAHIHCQSQYSFWLSKNAGSQTHWQLTATQTADVPVQGPRGQGLGV